MIDVPFYPAPGSMGYVYLNSMQNEEDEIPKQVYSVAVRTVETAKAKFQTENYKRALKNLYGLVISERAAEEAFLSARLNLSLAEIQGYGFKQLIESFNKVLNLQTSYEAAVSRVIAIEKGELKSGQMNRLYSLLNYTFPQKLKKFIGELIKTIDGCEALVKGEYDDIIKAQGAAIITEELIKVFGENGTASEEYSELAQLIQQLISTGDLVQKIVEGYGVDLDSLKTRAQEIVSEKRKVKDKMKIKGSDLILNKRGGNMFEVFTNEVLVNIVGSFNGQSFSTGGLNNMKADHIIEIGFGGKISELETYVQNERGQGEASNRIKNIQAIQKFFKDLGDVKGDIVFVSDKNYRLNTKDFADNKGFAAENPTFQNLGKVLGKVGIKDLESLIFVLANSGSGRINNEFGGLEKYLATTIANFLFDDVVISSELKKNNSSTNRIHVFNLGDIYIPLSVFLEGTLQALNDISMDYTDYVNVKISPSSLSYTEQKDGLTQSDWSNLYQQAVSGGHVAFHFFGNFMNFVKTYLQ